MPTEPPTKPATTPQEEKSETQKFDRFRPAMPQIPGVSNVPAKQSQGMSGIDLGQLAKIGGIVAAVLVIGVAILLWIKRTPPKAVESSSPDAAATESTDSPSLLTPVEPPRRTNCCGNHRRTLQALGRKKFTFVKPITQETVRAMVIRSRRWSLGIFLTGSLRTVRIGLLPTQANLRPNMVTAPAIPWSSIHAIARCTIRLKLARSAGNVWVRGQVVEGDGLEASHFHRCSSQRPFDYRRPYRVASLSMSQGA